jgi:hypothetical protein
VGGKYFTYFDEEIIFFKHVLKGAHPVWLVADDSLREHVMY